MRKKLPKPKHLRLPLTRRAKKAKLLEAKEAAKAMSTRNPDNQIEKIDDVIEVKNLESKKMTKTSKAKRPVKNQLAVKGTVTKKIFDDAIIEKPVDSQLTNKRTVAKPKKRAARNTTARKTSVNKEAISRRINSLVSYIRQRRKMLKQSWETNKIPRKKLFNKNARISRFSVTNIVTVIVVVLAIVTSSTLYHYRNKWKTEYNKYITEGDKYLESDQYLEAAKSYMQAVVLKAGDEETYLKLSEAYVEAKDYQSAVRILEEANSIKVSLTLVERMNSIINIAEAAGIELETNRVKNDIAATNYQLGQHYFEAGDYTTARIYFSSANEYSDSVTYLAQIDDILNIEDTVSTIPETTVVQTVSPETTVAESTTTAPEITTAAETTTQSDTEPEIVERTLAEITTTVASTTAEVEPEPETTARAPETIPPTTTATQPADSGKDSSYIIADSSTRLLTREELSKYSKAELRMIRNEIFAREGRLFTDPDLQSYFNNKSWYHGSIPSGEFKDSMLNDVELANVILIMELE